MKKYFLILFCLLLISCGVVPAQVPIDTAIQIVKAEDARRFDVTLEKLLKSPNPAIRARAAIAAGRIGDEKAIPVLSELLKDEHSEQVYAMTAFALGEIESSRGADAILAILNDKTVSDAVRARAVEAAGKIASANPKDDRSKALTEAILKTLDDQNRLGAKQDRKTVLLALTAAGRIGNNDPKRKRPDDTDFITAEFLKSRDARIRSDAANTMARLRSGNADPALRTMLATDADAVARSNAAHALGAAGDVKASDVLIKAATQDIDLRVRVSAIRALAGLKDPKAADTLLARGEKLLAAYKRSRFDRPVEKNEVIEIAAVVGRLLSHTGNGRAVKFLDELTTLDAGHTADIAIARMRVKPGNFEIAPDALQTWWGLSTTAQVAAELATLFPITAEEKKMKTEAPVLLRRVAETAATGYPGNDDEDIMAAPELMRSFAQFKTKDLDEFLRTGLSHDDVFVRTAAAELMAERPASKENVAALKAAYDRAAIGDKEYDDARLAILDALFKLDKKEAAASLLLALNSPDYLTRKKAIDLLADKDLQKLSPGVPTLLEQAVAKRKDTVLPYTAAYATKLGQMMSTEADYLRAVSRKNGVVKAVVTTEKGSFTIDLFPEDAPLTVDNFIKLARLDYFNGHEVHRVVPNFVMQDGDPRGDGNGGPGWSIRCEINTREYDRGAVGMALSGKDTGGSQWFVTHSPQPHLDGGYTVFGHVNEIGMKVVDNIVRGDKIVSIKIIGEQAPPQEAKPKVAEEPIPTQKTPSTPRRKSKK